MNTSVEALELAHIPLFTGWEACPNDMQGIRKGWTSIFPQHTTVRSSHISHYAYSSKKYGDSNLFYFEVTMLWGATDVWEVCNQWQVFIVCLFVCFRKTLSNDINIPLVKGWRNNLNRLCFLAKITENRVNKTNPFAPFNFLIYFQPAVLINSTISTVTSTTCSYIQFLLSYSWIRVSYEMTDHTSMASNLIQKNKLPQQSNKTRWSEL